MSKTRKDTTGDTAEKVADGAQDDAKPIANPLLAEIIITVLAAILRNGVVRLLERGNIVQTAEDKKLLSTSPSRRMAVLGVKKVATRSVPGAVAVGAGIVVQSLWRNRKTRKIDSLAAPEKPPVTPLEDHSET